MGILDQFLSGQFSPDPDRNAAAQQGLLQAGLAMLASKGSFANALGQAGMHGLQGFQNTQRNQYETRKQGFELGELERRRADGERMNRRFDVARKHYRSPGATALAGGGGPTMANAARIGAPSYDFNGYANEVAQFDPAEGMRILQAQAKDTPYGKVNPSDYTQDSLARFNVSRNFADLIPARKREMVGGQWVDPYAVAPGSAANDLRPNQPFMSVGGQIVPNVPYQQYETRRAKAGAPNTTVTNLNTQESEQSKVYGRGLGETRTAINNAAFSAPSQMRKLERIEELLKGIDGGNLTKAGTAVASAAQSIGIKIDPRLGDKEAAEALARELAGALRQPGTGPMTDKDFENFLQQVPNLSKTANGRSQIISTMRAALKRDMEIGKRARAYAGKNQGTIDDRFFDEISEYYATNPVVQPSAPIPAPTGNIDDLVKHYRSR